MLCIMPNVWSKVDDNYSHTSKIYEAKKQAILQRLQQENNINGQDFINSLQINYKELMQQKYTSNLNNREVKLETILSHVYKAAEQLAQQILEEQSGDVVEQIDALMKISQETGQDIDQQKKIIAKELDKIIERYEAETRVSQLINEMLPKFVSSDNQQLSTDQIYSYTKSILKQEIAKRASITNIEKAVRKHPSIILGYIREDAITQAALRAVEQLKSNYISARTVGSEKSTIDIIIPVTGEAKVAVLQGGQGLSDIIKQLDTLGQNFVVSGESQYDTDEFLGIQSKPWKLYLKTTNWNKNSLGSRATLLREFQLENILGIPNDLIGWHKGVLFLSQRLQQVIGPNTVMYATGNSLTWTSDLLNDLVNTYHKYFAFMVDSKNKLTSHIHLADHYG